MSFGELKKILIPSSNQACQLRMGLSHDVRLLAASQNGFCFHCYFYSSLYFFCIYRIIRLTAVCKPNCPMATLKLCSQLSPQNRSLSDYHCTYQNFKCILCVSVVISLATNFSLYHIYPTKATHVFIILCPVCIHCVKHLFTFGGLSFSNILVKLG